MNFHSPEQQNHFSSSSVTDTTFNFSSIISWFQTCCNDYVYHLARRQEPHIWQKCDRFGSLQWYGYDSRTGRSIKCATEDDVRIWVEGVLYR